MNASYSQPLSLGWDRMKKALFHPFDLNKWLRVGFTAWLAGLTDCNGGSSGNNSSHNNFDWDDFFNFPQTAWEWLTDHPLWSVSYTHLRAHETKANLVCRLLLEKKKKHNTKKKKKKHKKTKKKKPKQQTKKT